MRASAVSLVILLLLGQAGCSLFSKPPAAEVLATFRGGQITATDLDHAVLELPAGQRFPQDQDLVAWYEKLVRDAALRQILLLEAKSKGVDQERDFHEQLEDLRRQATVTLYLERTLPPSQPLTEQQLRAAYGNQPERFHRPERRLVYHIFKRADDPSQLAELIPKMRQLRQRVLAGASFSALATSDSDSELRHRQGLLGWVERGELSPDLERLIFSLPAGQPSAVIRSRQGLHLFLVSKVLKEKVFGFDEVRTVLAPELDQQHRDQAIRELIERVAGTQQPPGSFVPTAQELSELLASAPPQTIVLRIGPFHERLQSFKRRILTLTQQISGRPPSNLAQVVLNSLKQRELLYQYAAAAALRGDKTLQRRVDQVQDKALIDFYLRQQLRQQILGDPKRLSDYYQANQRRFSEPLRLHLRRLTVPLTTQANRFMELLENWRAQLDEGHKSLESVAKALGGEVQDLGWQSLEQIQRLGENPVRFAVQLTKGRHSPPYRTESTLEMLEAVDRKEPQIQPLERVKDQIAEDYLLGHGKQLYADLSRSRLTAAGFRVYHDHLQRLAARPTAS